jgi:hypothetical protein
MSKKKIEIILCASNKYRIFYGRWLEISLKNGKIFNVIFGLADVEPLQK